MSTSPAYTFLLLGSFEVRAADQQLDLGGRKPAALLALLVVHANEVLAADRLVDELWGDEPPRTARKTLQVHVSRLRRILGEGVLETRPHGYVLRVEPEQVDLHRFGRLVEAGRDELDGGNARAAAAVLREALALWRGPALAGFEDEPFARAAAARLEDLRLAALELRIEADLHLGRHATLVPELESLVAQHPFRERFRRHLILALYRSGRQADALAAYRDARRTLVAELGVEPGPELRALEAAVLRQDPALAAPVLLARRRRGRRGALVAAVVLAAFGAAALVIAFRSSDEPPLEPPTVVANSLVRIDPRTNRIADVVRVGRDPDQVAVGAGAVWVVNQRDRTVSRMQPGRAVDTIGGVPFADHLVVDGDDVWVSSFDHASVARIDARTGEVVESVGLPSRHAEGLAVGGGYLWVTNPAVVRAQGRETVSRLDPRSGRVVSTIAVGKTPIFTTFGYGAVWVSNYDDDTVSVIAPGSPAAATIPVGDGPLGIATGFGATWVVCYWVQELQRIDPRGRRVVARIPIGAGPLDVTTGAGSVWVTNRDSRSLMRIDPRRNKVVATIRFPPDLAPRGVAAGGGAIWVAVQRCLAQHCI